MFDHVYIQMICYLQGKETNHQSKKVDTLSYCLLLIYCMLIVQSIRHDDVLLVQPGQLITEIMDIGGDTRSDKGIKKGKTRRKEFFSIISFGD